MAACKGLDASPARSGHNYQHAQIQGGAKAHLGDSYHISEFLPESSNNGVTLTFTRQLCRPHDQYASHFCYFVAISLHSSDSPALARADYIGHFSHTSLHPVKAFVQRPALYEKIRKQLQDGAGDGDAAHHGTKTVVVWGLGGTGKTQLALDYLQRHRNEYKATFWIEAGGKESIERDFMHIYRLLFDVHVLIGQEVKIDDVVRAVKNWFSERCDRWLFVFNGADAIDNKDASDYIDLKHFIPDSSYLQVIVTTRSRTAKDMSPLEGVEVGEMDESQAVELFFNLSTLNDRLQGIEDEVKRIVKELGYLALAITLAGTYVAQTPRLMSNIRQYLPEETGAFVSSIGRWPEACSVRGFVARESGKLLGEEHPDTISAMSNLASTLGDQGQLDESARMMKKVLEKMRHILGEEHPSTITAMSNLAITLGHQGQLDEAAKMKKEVLEKRRRILGEEHLDTIVAMHNLAATLGEQGQLDEAAKMREEVLKKMRRILGDEHPDTISAMNNFASMLGDQGQLDEVARMKKEVLEKRRRILGEEHPDTISAMNNLASTLREQGQLNEAAKMQKEVLEKRRRILGEEHPDTISAMSNLASTLGDQGQLDEAVRMEKEVLEKRRRILGEEHPDTIVAMNNLASTLGDQGQLDEAAKMEKEVLEKRRRVLGEEHPSTISAMNNLAITLGDQGRLDEAVEMMHKVVHDMDRICGEAHPTTRVAKANLIRLAGMEAFRRHRRKLQ
jgi:tetratricopeptide (TPR) repeat protein